MLELYFSTDWEQLEHLTLLRNLITLKTNVHLHHTGVATVYKYSDNECNPPKPCNI